MMKKIYLLTLLLLPLWAGAFSPVQPWPLRNGNSIFPSASLPSWKSESELKELAYNYLKTHIPDLSPTTVGLKEYSTRKSPFGWHISYTQQYGGYEVYATEAKINIADNGRILSVFYKTANTTNWSLTPEVPAADRSRVMAAVGPCDNISITPVLYPLEGQYIGAYQVVYAKKDGNIHKQAVLNANYEVIFEADMDRSYKGKDTTSHGMVFYPDPLTSAKKTYGAPYVDAHDSDIMELNAQRVKKTFPTTFINDTFYLISPYAKIVDNSPPSTPLTYSTTGEFNYTRSEPGFEDVNAFFHIHNYRDHLTALGFENLGKRQLQVDAHALSGIDNSRFSDTDSTNLSLWFGQGGIDDAEDADVIVHEYSHFLSFAAAPYSVFGSERSALDEGLCDYFACSYSKNISSYNWEKVYSWDGNESWDGRSCYTTKKYPTDMVFNEHYDGEIWSGCLMDVWSEIGRDQADKLMLMSLYSMGRYISMTDAAKIFLQADTISAHGGNVWRMVNKFVDHGLLPDKYKTDIAEKLPSIPYKLISSYFSSDNLIYVEFDLPQSGSISLYDLQGRLITNEMVNGAKVTISTPALKPGIYLLRINTDGAQKCEKLIRQ